MHKTRESVDRFIDTSPGYITTNAAVAVFCYSYSSGFNAEFNYEKRKSNNKMKGGEREDLAVNK
jgi:hypothetical protein